LNAELLVWQRLHRAEHAGLVAAAAKTHPGDASGVARLRRTADAELVRAALLLSKARSKARAKFGDPADALWADPDGVEMASSMSAARHKAGRMSSVLPGARAVDLCCGIGGDAMAMRDAGLVTECVDLDPVRAWMAGVNAGGIARCADAIDPASIGPGVRLVHIDPARRTADGSRRSWRIDDLRPGPDEVAGVVARLATAAGGSGWGACVKLGPGVSAGDAARVIGGAPFELEFISERGRLTQALAWAGGLAPSARTATLLDERGTHTLAGDPGRPAPVGPLGAWVYEPDDSVERAGLLGALCARTGLVMPHEHCGLLTGPGNVRDPMLTEFEVLGEDAWSPRRVRERIRELGGGIVEIKTRGGLVDPDRVQADLRGEGERRLTVFVVRMGRGPRAIIARRLGGCDVTPP
jgi:hypothetical protein